MPKWCIKKGYDAESHCAEYASAKATIEALGRDFRGSSVIVISEACPIRFLDISDIGKVSFSLAHETPIRQGDTCTAAHLERQQVAS